MTEPATAATHPEGSSASLREMWRRQARWWHVVFAALVLVTGAIAVATGVRVMAQLAILLALSIAYALWGARALNPATPRSLAVAYLSVAWVLFVALLAVGGAGAQWLLAFAVFPQTWAMLGVRWALVVTVVGSLVLGTVTWLATDRSDGAAAAVAISTGISLVLSIVLGRYIDRLVNEAEGRAHIIDELNRTRARLVAAERDRGVHEERERISREIHDTLAQGFTSVLALSRAAESALARGDVPTARERLALVEQTAGDNLREARVIVAELTPGHLQSRTLQEALDRLVRAVSVEGGVDARLDVVGEPVPLGTSAEVVLLRTAQEALANVRRHAGASTATVALSYAAPDAVVLEVADDGRGFDVDGVGRGFGLDGISARAGEVGGTAVVTSRPGGGTVVRLEVPR